MTVTPRAASTRELLADLSSVDSNARALALAELVARRASMDLVPLLNRAEPELRFQAARGLAHIADPATADALDLAGGDVDERVRANAAYGLFRMGDARALDALIATLDDFPDILRSPFTLAVDALVEVGQPALPRVVPLLDASDSQTRARAFLVLRSVIEASSDVADFQALWRSLECYDPNGAEPQRHAAALRWRDWIAARAGR